MYRILFLQILRRSSWGDTRPVFDQEIGQLSATLREQGHETFLLRVDEFQATPLLAKLDQHQPDVIYAVIGGTSMDVARRTLAEIEKNHPLPVIVGGSVATLLPDQALSLPGVRAVLRGEPDHSFPAYLSSLKSADTQAEVDGIWSNTNGRVSRNGSVGLVRTLDALPFADRELFETASEVEVVDVVVGRGCPARCAYCGNDRLREVSGAGDAFVRRRSPEHICDELDELCETFPEIRMVRFKDHGFVHDLAWLEEFTQVYENRCGIPFHCHVRANVFDQARADLLQRAGCVAAEIEVVTGSDFIRNEILEMQTTEPQIDAACKLLRQRGITTHAVSFVGAPYSSAEAETKTVELNRRLDPEMVDIRVYFPFYGTPARDLCREMGWLSNRPEAGYSESLSVLDMPSMDAETIRKISLRMPDAIAGTSSWGVRRTLRGLVDGSRRKMRGVFAAMTAGRSRLKSLARRW